MTPQVRRLMIVVCALASAGALPGHAAAQSSSFAQLTGARGCVSQDPGGFEESLDGCTRARGLIRARDLAVSPDDRYVYVASAGFVGSGSNAVVVLRRDGDTGALAPVECVSDTGGDGRVGTDGFCANGDALLGAGDITLSPDGRDVFVASGSSGGLSWFGRDPETGRLTPRGCFKAFPRGDRCRTSFSLEGASGVAVSPDGRHVYVSAAASGAVSVFARDAETGGLEPLTCVSDDGADGRCADGTALEGASSVTVAPDGRHVFVTAATIGSVTVYGRDAETGALTPQACLLDDAVEGGSCRRGPALEGAASSAISPDGKTLFVASREDSALALFARNPDTGALTADTCFRHEDPKGDDEVNEESEEEEESEEDPGDEEADSAAATSCREAKALGSAQEVTVSPDGRGVFVTGSDYLAAFQRNPSTGSLEQFGCAEDELTYKSCAQARGLSGATGLAVSSDARSLYVANETAHAVAVFGASVAIASRAAAAGRGGRFRVALACPAARGRACAGRLRTGSGTTRAYRVAAGRARSIATRLPSRLRRVLRRRGQVRVSLTAADSRRWTRASVRRVLVRRARRTRGVRGRSPRGR